MVDLRNYTGQQTGQLAKEWVYERTGKRREYVIPANPRTAEQQAGRGRFGDVLRELVLAGEELRAVLKGALGYRWHAEIIGECMRDGGIMWEKHAEEFAAFDAGNQTAWAEYDHLGGLVGDQGEVFYLVASVTWQMCFYAGVSPGYSKPSETNSAAVAAAWPRESGMIYLTQAEANLLYEPLIGLASGSYAPGLYAGYNIDSFTLNSDFTYLRIGNVVMLSGWVGINPTAAGLAAVDFDLPFETEFTSSAGINGNATAVYANSYTGSVVGEAVNNRGRIVINTTDGAELGWRVVAMYEIVEA